MFPVLIPVPRNPVVAPVSASVKMVCPPTKKLPCSFRTRESAMVATAAARSKTNEVASRTDGRTKLLSARLFLMGNSSNRFRLAEKYHALQLRAKQGIGGRK